VRAPQITALGLTPVNGFDWVAVLLNTENWSEDDAKLVVADHQLLTYGAYGVAGAAADPITKVVAQNVGLDPALGIADTTTIDPGDGLRLMLVYLIRPDTTLLQLTTGQTTIDLTPALGSAVPISDPGPEPEAPELMEVKVVEVLDGQSILVQTDDGARTRVRYLGVEAPIGNACYAGKSQKANAELVEGETVYLERERKNRASNSRIARDVWIEDADGNLTLVAAELAAEGSVVAAPVEPDVRFAGWIQAAADGAMSNNLGLWGACGGLQTPEPEPVGNVSAERVLLVPQNEQGVLPIGLT
jgi:endonuclease YncB( thermonuclease family)